MVGILLSYWDGLFIFRGYVSFREGSHGYMFRQPEIPNLNLHSFVIAEKGGSNPMRSLAFFFQVVMACRDFQKADPWYRNHKGPKK